MKKPYVPRPQKPIGHIVWSQEQVNQLTADFTKTIETLTAELARCHKERDEFIKMLKARTTDIYHRLNEHDVWGVGGDVVCDNCEEFVQKQIDRIAKECFK